MVFIATDRFLGNEQQKKFVASLRKHSCVIIADTLTGGRSFLKETREVSKEFLLATTSPSFNNKISFS